MHNQEWIVTDRVIEIVEELAMRACNERRIACFLGVGYDAYKRASKREPRLVQAFERGFARGAQTINNSAYDIATNNTQTREQLAAIIFMANRFDKVEEKMEADSTVAWSNEKLQSTGLVHPEQIKAIEMYWEGKQKEDVVDAEEVSDG